MAGEELKRIRKRGAGDRVVMDSATGQAPPAIGPSDPGPKAAEMPEWLPVLECPAEGKVEKQLETPIPCYIRVQPGKSGGAETLLPARVVGIEINSGLVPGTGTPSQVAGAQVEVRARGVTCYHVEADDPRPSREKQPTMTLTADLLAPRH